jgi:hypothetical protein
MTLGRVKACPGHVSLKPVWITCTHVKRPPQPSPCVQIHLQCRRQWILPRPCRVWRTRLPGPIRQTRLQCPLLRTRLQPRSRVLCLVLQTWSSHKLVVPTCQYTPTASHQGLESSAPGHVEADRPLYLLYGDVDMYVCDCMSSPGGASMRHLKGLAPQRRAKASGHA